MKTEIKQFTESRSKQMETLTVERIRKIDEKLEQRLENIEKEESKT